MKITRYFGKNGEDYGVQKSNAIISLPILANSHSTKLPKKLESFIENENRLLKIAKKLLNSANCKEIELATESPGSYTLLAPLAAPGKIICLGLNYRDHAAETKAQIPDEPIIFMKPHTAIIGPYQKIVKPKFVKQLDYEGELAIVMGRRTKNITASEAKKHIFGYTILNDVSARDIQFKDGQWTRGKSIDTFAPIGPCITTTDQLKETQNLTIQTWINNELRQNATTQNMIFSVEEVVHQLSRIMTLEPCDIIATGTPAGVGFAMNPKKFLKHGDTIRIKIQGIGILENTVEEET